MNFDKIAFLDIEVGGTNGKINSLGYLSAVLKVETGSVSKITNLCLGDDIQFICGHNFVEHDRKFLAKTSFNQVLTKTKIIDSLYLSMLLFPNRSTHKLDKPYKNNLINIDNQPLGDAIQTQALFTFLNAEFDTLSKQKQQIFYQLLKNDEHFSGFFSFKALNYQPIDVYQQIKKSIVINKTDFQLIESNQTIELAFVISYLLGKDKGAISSVILHRYPKIVALLKQLIFDKNKINIHQFSQNEFAIEDFRKFDANLGDLFSAQISQEDIINTALDTDSLLAILPTGGGKTITFQIPALIKAQKYKGLSVVISPLQALMKDQVDSFRRKNNNFKVIAISGYLSSIERMNAIFELENGLVDILYLAPESLRSNSIFKALKKRVIERFIIDEAHCFSSWGHDFRHDYYFIADTIKELEQSEFQSKIPVSCFTATAKPEVIADIKKYFQDKLAIQLKEFIASVERYNLDYSVIKTESAEQKYEELIKILNKFGKNPTIIYAPQNAKACKELSEKLQNDERLSELDLVIEPFYAKLDEDKENHKRDKNARGKSAILADFINNEVDIVVATTAFGMGIDKADIQTIIHYQQSDSLESYLQESGRGARDEKLTAKCIVLYSKTDFDRSFNQLNRSKVDIAEIKRIVKALKSYKNNLLHLSPKDIARKMGVDVEDGNIDYEIIIKTALLELEKCNIIKRGRDGYQIFATSVSKQQQNQGMNFVHQVLDPKKQQEPYIRLYKDMILVMQNIIQRSKLNAVEVDDLSDIVGVEKIKMFEILYQLQKDGLLKFENDISAYIKKSVEQEFTDHFAIEDMVFNALKDMPDYEQSINLRSLNSDSSNQVNLFKQIIQSWLSLTKLKNGIIFKARFTNDICHFEFVDKTDLDDLINARKDLSNFIIEQLLNILGEDKAREIEFCSNEIKFKRDSEKLTMESFHHTLVYLHNMLKSFELRRGRLIYYHTFKLDLQAKIKDRMPYQTGDYKDGLEHYYQYKIEAIHIQIAFLEKLLAQKWQYTKGFVKDYFSIDYQKFKKAYNLNEQEIKRPVTKEKYQEILLDLNSEQKQIFNDTTSQAIMVLAGPGSGKTKTLVHKIASLITIENNKAQYFLMLAHSRTAVADFTTKLKNLIGDQVYYMHIHTFHSFAISLLGKNIDNESNLQGVIKKAAKLLEVEKITMPFINMLVIDEYQDVGEQSYAFIKAIYSKMGDSKQDKKIIAVGDDDQCIKNFGDDKADIKYIKEFGQYFGKDIAEDIKFSSYELLNNYRSKANIVDFFSQFSNIITQRLKTNKLNAFKKEDGIIVLTRYQNNDYYTNILNSVKNSPSNNIAILAKTNDEVLLIYSMLIAEGIKTRYITDNYGFKIGDLVELRDFLYDWQKTTNFEKSRENSDIIYKKSKNNVLKNQVLDKFAEHYELEIKKSQNHFIGVFAQYLYEITFDEFEFSKTKVVVSTMHKAKGKEWDEVYICAQQDFIKTKPQQAEYDKRLAYVAITRAKSRLYIHSKTPLFDKFSNYFDEVNDCNTQFEPIKTIVLLMTLKDIALSDCYSKTGVLKSQPMAGEVVDVVKKSQHIKIVKNGHQIATLSKEMIGKIKTKKGYKLDNKAQIEDVVEWIDKQDQEKYRQVLCKIYLSKEN